VLNSYLNDLELLKTINEGFNLPAESDSKKALIDKLNEFLVSEFSLGHNLVLIIDESQNLQPQTLEQIRMISNLETETAKLIQIILIGQPELRKTLGLPELEQLNQRITVRYHIAPLDENEVGEYIRHRLAVAEPQVDVTFTPQAVRQIFHYSRGIPRRINVICDRCLLVGYVTGTFSIDDKAVERAVNEVQGDLQKYVPPTSAAAQPLESDVPSAGKRGGKVLLALGKAAALFLVVALGVAVGMMMMNRDYSTISKKTDKATEVAAAEKKQSKKNKRKMRNAAEAAAPAAEAVADAVQAANAGGDATATTALASPTPTPRPTPRPITYDNWQIDAENTVRVNQPKLTEAASYVNLIHRWNIDVDLETFRGASPDEVANYDLLNMVKPLNFNAYRADNINEAFKLDLPVLARIRDEQGKETWAVISAFNGEVLEVIDPIQGKRMVKRQKFQPLVTEAIVLYQDPTGLTQLKPGDSGDQVIKLQIWLTQERCFEGAPDGKFGQKTRDAVEKFQLKNSLKETGRIDELTGAIMASRLNPRRPRLYQ
jgi:hypothetical protein